MNMIQLSKSEFLEIVDLAKSLKQKNVMFINGTIVGTDFPQSCLIYTRTSFLRGEINGMIFNYKNISACAKMLLDDIIVLQSLDGKHYYNSLGVNSIVHNNMAIRILESCAHNIIPNDYAEDITQEIQRLFSLRKGDGGYRYIHNGRCMTLFSGLLPLNKNDKVKLSICDDSSSSFIARFDIYKAKHIIITVTLRYLKI